jgi:hypothetical protein
LSLFVADRLAIAAIMGGSSLTPPFDGHSFTGRFDGETSVLREVARMIKEDIETHLTASRSATYSTHDPVPINFP